MRHRFSFAILLIALALARGAELPLAPHRPVVIAHRGDHTQAHENSLPAIEAAIRAGADFVEVDLRQTRDGELILMHDSNVDRTTDGRGKVAELAWAEIAPLHLTDPKRPQLAPASVPKFAEALKLMRGRIGLYLDFKDADRATAVRQLRDADMMRATVVYDDLPNIAAWRKIAPALPLMVSPRPEDLRGDALTRLRELYPVEVLDDDAANYAPESVKAAHVAGFQVWPDIQGPHENEAFWERMLALDADGLQTDKPGELVAYLKRRGKR